MKKLILSLLAAATVASPALAAPASLPSPSTVTTVTTEPPTTTVSACATGQGGQRLACAHVQRDGDGRAAATTCAYDGALAILGWADDAEVVCLETTEDWGFVGGAGVCERALNTEQPQVCVNGRGRCLLWVMGVRFVCWAGPSEEP